MRTLEVSLEVIQLMVSYEESLTPVKQFPISTTVWGDRKLDLDWDDSGLFGTGSKAAKNGVGKVLQQ